MLKTFLIIMILALNFKILFAQNCADSSNIYTFYFNDQKFEIVKEAKTWVEAAECAVERGGILAEINSQEEQDTLFFYLNNSEIDPGETVAPDGGNASYIWIGGNDIAKESSWIWDGNNDNYGFQFWQGASTGNPVNELYNNWGNEPDNFNDQDGLGIGITSWPRGMAGQWNDVSATNNLYYIIEYGSRTARIKETNYLYKEELLAIHTFFTASFDSITLTINNSLLNTYYDITEQDSIIKIPINDSKSKIYNVQLKAYFEGILMAVSQSNIEVYSFKNPVESYYTDFEENPFDDFMGDNFIIERHFGFSNMAIHSEHNYQSSGNFSFTLTKPIIVSNTDAKMMWSEVAIIQPGDSGSVFGQPEFKDYVIVEGSKEADVWIPLLNGYDASLYPEWEQGWFQSTIYRNLYKSRTINLTDTFTAGDTILIRFRLFSDESETGWGWTIDSLQIQNFPLSINDKSNQLHSFSLLQNYPNPFNPITTIAYSLPKASKINLKIYNITGQEIKTLISEFQQPGNKKVVWDGRNEQGKAVPSGIYLYEIKAGDYKESRKAILLK